MTNTCFLSQWPSSLRPSGSTYVHNYAQKINIYFSSLVAKQTLGKYSFSRTIKWHVPSNRIDKVLLLTVICYTGGYFTQNNYMLGRNCNMKVKPWVKMDHSRVFEANLFHPCIFTLWTRNHRCKEMKWRNPLLSTPVKTGTKHAIAPPTHFISSTQTLTADTITLKPQQTTNTADKQCAFYEAMKWIVKYTLGLLLYIVQL